ncbi:MAG: hypothetical protein IPG96_09645 [Proteobacteria bacterium]|nr:hypothetical protein [Pseudomonadota bacterium]
MSVDPAALGAVEQLLWVVDRAQPGDAVSVDSVHLVTRVLALAPEQQAFL